MNFAESVFLRHPPLRTGVLLASLALATSALADDGYRLWLRYDQIADEPLRNGYADVCQEVVVAVDPANSGATESGALAAAQAELQTGLRGLLGRDVPAGAASSRRAGIVIGTTGHPLLRPFVTDADRQSLGDEGYVLRQVVSGNRRLIIIAGRREIGALYGAFAFLRQLQLGRPLEKLNIVSAPRVARRMLNHWDNLDRTVERGYAGASLWEWDKLPGELSPRYRDYARANASLGINGVVPVNVNANAQFLTPVYLRKIAALATVFRPYGIRMYLTARFSAPIEIGGLKTADPLDPAVIAWWATKADEIYRAIPDFGGFLVKANSEGQPGPQTYHRTHADGANCLADAVARHGGIVIWRAFVYDASNTEDRHRQAVTEFKPLDGKFHDNVIIQVKNGPIDFMPREPFHPLFGAMSHTPLALELQITQEYLGGSGELAFLAPLWRETLTADTRRPTAGTTVAQIIDGTVRPTPTTVIAGVANTGANRNWCGNVLAPANWYAFGRLAWDHTLTSEQLADEWTRLTFSSDPAVVRPITAMLLASRETVVNYSMPLGLHHIMARGHHQGPGPWVTGGRADQTSVYFHRADANGIGFERTPSGSNALDQYAPEVAERWGDLKTCPDEYLLWFHHLPWDYRMRSGHTLWDEICLHYQRGVDTVRDWQKSWAALRGKIDDERFTAVENLLRRQEREARIWRDACLQYFATFARRPLPAGVEPPSWPLSQLRVAAPFSVKDN